MLAVQPRLPLGLPMQVRARRCRRPFHPSQGEGPYCLPRDVQDRLTTALAPYRNRDAAFALAVFLARFWSSPRRIIDAFPIDRRALADHPALDLTEKQVRTAIRTLEEIGFLDRAVASGSRYRATEDGLHRKPVLFMFGAEYGSLFVAANRRAAAAAGRRRAAAVNQVPATARRASPADFGAAAPNGPKSKIQPERSVLMGPITPCGQLPITFVPNPALEAALDRLLQGIRQSRGG